MINCSLVGPHPESTVPIASPSVTPTPPGGRDPPHASLARRPPIRKILEPFGRFCNFVRDLIPHAGHQAKWTGPPNRSRPGQKATATCRISRRSAKWVGAPTAARLGQNPTWERQVPPRPRSYQIQTKSAESLCHSHAEVGGPIQGSDQDLNAEEDTPAFGRSDRNDQPDHPRMGKLLLSLPR